MEVTSLCIRLLMTVFWLLVTQVDFSYSQKADASFPQVVPNRQQHFEYESIVVSCEGLEGLTGWRVMRKIEGVITTCSSAWSTSTGPCNINNAFPASDSGEYWCEMGGKKSNTVNITVTAGSVILESPVLRVMEREAVTLSCRQKQTSTNLTTQFFKDDHFMEKSSTGIMTIHSVSKSFEGLYKCRISGAGESPESWLVVRAGSVILESPVFPVKEGETVTLSCRKKRTSSNLTADFYKDGRLIRSSSTGEMTLHSVSKFDEGFYKCSISGAGESPERSLTVSAGSVILGSPVLPVKEGNNVTLSCRNKTTSSHHQADFYKDGRLIRSSSTGEMTIHSVSKSDEGLYKCSISGAEESPETWLAVRAPPRETCSFSDHFIYVLLILRTVFTIVMVALLLLLVGLLHSGKLRVKPK